MMHEYVTVPTTGIMFHAIKRIVFVTFYHFPVNPYASRPNYFARVLLFFVLFITLNPCTLVYPLCLDQQLRWLGTKLRVHIQFFWSCYVLLL